MIWRILYILALIALAALAALAALTLVEFVMNPGAYRFGSEVAGFRYGSAARYVGVAAVELALAVGAILLSLRLRSPLRRLAVTAVGLIGPLALALL